jgi:hypothetical protein
MLDAAGRKAASLHANATAELLSSLCRESDRSILRVVASHPKTDASTLSILACNIDAKVRLSVAQNPFATEEALYRLLRDSQDEVRRAAAQNPKAPASFRALLTRLWLRDDFTGYLSGQKSISIQDLGTLEQHGLWGLVFFARHPELPEAVLLYLTSHRAPAVRCSVARNPSASAAVLSILARDFDQRVRIVVSLHPKLPENLRDALLSVGEPTLFDATKLAPINSVTPEAAELRQIAARFSSTEARLENLMRDSAWYVRHSVARNPSAPSTMLEVLARDTDPRVRRAVAQNPKTPYYSLENLARDLDLSVQTQARALLQSSVAYSPLLRTKRNIVCHPSSRAQPHHAPAQKRRTALQWTHWNQSKS